MGGRLVGDLKTEHKAVTAPWKSGPGGGGGGSWRLERNWRRVGRMGHRGMASPNRVVRWSKTLERGLTDRGAG